MIKVAIYGLVRVLVEWVGILPTWFGVLVLGVGALSAVGGVVYALFQHDLKRLLALHSIENVGIIVLGLGACLLLRAQGADEWAAFALGGGLLHTAQPRGLQGAALPRRGRVREGGRPLELTGWADPAEHAVDRRRVSRRRDGDRRAAAAERLRLGVAHPAGAAARPGLRRCRRWGSRVWRRWRRWPPPRRSPLSLREGRRARAARPAPPRRPGGRGAGRDARSRRRAGGRLCRPGARPGAAFRLARRAGAVVKPPPTRSACSFRARARCPPPGSPSNWSGSPPLRLCAAGASRAPAPTWACGQRVEPRLQWTSAGFTKPLRLMLEVAALRSARSSCARPAASCRTSPTAGTPHLIDEHLLPARRTPRWRGAVHARRLQKGRLGRTSRT